METISKEEAAWLAGIIDGEGCLQLSLRAKPRKTFRLAIEVTNTCPYMIKRISEIYAKLGVVFYFAWGKWRGDSEYIRIGTTGFGSVTKVLQAVLPYLVTKRGQADRMLAFTEWRKTQPYGNPTASSRAGIAEAYNKLRDELIADHRKRFHLQRLPRRASTPLDLSVLEAKV